MNIINKLFANKIIYLITISVLIALMVFVFSPLISSFEEYKLVKNENTKLLEEKKELEEKLAIINDNNLKKNLAREQYQLSKDGDILFIFPDED